MPIHDQGYRRYAGPRAEAGRAWSVIAMAGIRTLFAKRAFIGLLLLAWVPFVVRVVQIYAAANLPQAQFLGLTIPDPGMTQDADGHWRYSEIDWQRTIRANLKHYQPAYRTIIPETRIGYGRKRAALTVKPSLSRGLALRQRTEQ